ncbi:hypothetical protein K2X14_13645 [Acetobacter sp. TBRC 12305]|uniref:Uncharacterized protein n=1 Tax=Acetobacter garciniae TaxID=2817435 RepID=A0A939HR11_9PROT|nr:hypothetical protein [Acetobacter garciniae]MBO1325981.1 hypothetical protein [Acetobacter garciniae]MBX0345881.1 hypothetical protein [Acetobacter garciniae]
MKLFAHIGLASLLLGGATVLAAPGAHALSAKECHEKFKAAKTDGTLNGQSFKAFKAASCDDAAAAPASATPTTTPAPTAEKPKEAATTTPTPTTSASGAVFPTAIASQYSSLSAGTARRKTCDDQYKANKANNANGGLKWIQKGGGYYSECNKRLKG